MARQSQLGAGGGVLPRLVLSRPTHAPSRQDTPRRFPPTNDRGRASSGNGWDQLRLPRPDPCLGTVAERQGYGQASHSQKPLCPRGGRGERLVSATPARVHPRPAPTPVLDDAEPLRLLRRRQQHSTIAMVRPSGVRIWRKWLSRRDRQGVVRWTRLNEILTPSSAVSQDRPRIPPPRANLSREEPDAGNPHVRVCEGWGRQRPRLLGDDPSWRIGDELIQGC